MNGAFWPGFLLWCAIINHGILLLSFACFAGAHEAIYRLHRRWLDLPKASTRSSTSCSVSTRSGYGSS